MVQGHVARSAAASRRGASASPATGRRPNALVSEGPWPDRIGPYHVLERLGVGGVACVYRARRVGLRSSCDVALKRLHPHLLEDSISVASFVKEARIGLLLDHPCIRRVHSLSRVDDELFMTLEYVEGESLSAVLRRANRARHQLALAGVLTIATRLCDVLHYAHELVDEQGEALGFVHRDVSPSNLVIASSGLLKIIDMGVASARASDLVTCTGNIKGKFGYMAPEMLRGAEFDRRADIFSIGVVAWELLTSRKLFPVLDDSVHSYADISRIRARTIKPPSTFNPRCSPQLDRVLMRALTAEPEKRWGTVEAFGDALRDLAQQLGEPLSDTVVADWVIAADETAVATVPFERTPGSRLARGTTARPALPALPQSYSAASAPAVHQQQASGRCARCRRSLVLGAVVASLSTILFMALGAALLRAGTGPRNRPVSLVQPVASTVRRDADAGAALILEAPAAVVTSTQNVGGHAEPTLIRVSGSLPRSRGSRAQFRARLCIDTDGSVTYVGLIEGPSRLEARIKRTLRRWRYQPFMRDGVLRPACTEVTARLQKP